MNGIRAQLHRQGDRAALFSQDRRSLDDEFPEIRGAAQGLADDVVLDGALIAYAEGKTLTSSDLQKRLGRKRLEADLFLGESIPVRFMVFDLLWHNGESLLKKSLGERRRRLDLVTLPGCFHRVPVIEAKTLEAIEEALKQAPWRETEGLLAKDPASHYAPVGAGQAWLKLEK